jgi:hypothetical protein
MMTPDPNSPEFAREAERQAKLLRGRPEEEEAIRFAEAVFADIAKEQCEAEARAEAEFWDQLAAEASAAIDRQPD